MAARVARPELPNLPQRVVADPPDLGLRLQRAHLLRSPLPYVEYVVRGSPASKAGLLPDDLVFRLGERTLRSCRDYDEAVASLDASTDKNLSLLVKRGDRMLELELRLPAASGEGEQ